jgi:hypothetical protein
MLNLSAFGRDTLLDGAQGPFLGDVQTVFTATPDQLPPSPSCQAASVGHGETLVVAWPRMGVGGSGALHQACTKHAPNVPLLLRHGHHSHAPPLGTGP